MVGFWEIDGRLLGMAIGALDIDGKDDGELLAVLEGVWLGKTDIKDGRNEVLGSFEGHSLGFNEGQSLGSVDGTLVGI